MYTDSCILTKAPTSSEGSYAVLVRKIIAPYALETIFTRATPASAGISCRRVSVRPSVTTRCSTEMAKRRITQTTTHDSTGTLVF